MKKSFLVLLILIVNYKSIAQVTPIPDYRFEQALIDLNIDSDHSLNGQILTSDALLVTQLNLSPNSLPNYPYPASDIYEGMIHDLSGIEAFVNIENLVVNVTMIDNLNTGSLIHLKYLDCVDNMLTSLNVSNNSLLEFIKILNEGDVLPINDISEIDLTNNPLITQIIAPGINRINLNNNNNLQNMNINVACGIGCSGYPTDVIVGSVCIGVDNAELAQNNQFPYSQWLVYHDHISINYTNDLNQCSLSTSKFNQNKISVYPNPIQSDILYLVSNNSIISKIEIFDFTGRKVFENDQITDNINISKLQKGNYLINIISNKGNQTEKLIVE